MSKTTFGLGASLELPYGTAIQRVKEAFKKAINDHGHHVASKRCEYTESCARHHVNGARILVPTTPALMPRTGDGASANEEQEE